MTEEVNKRVLVVDDESSIREMLDEYLSKHGYRVSQAESAAGARELLRRESVDLALLDITMPGEDGLSLARHIREHHDFGVIMLTSADTVLDRIIGLEIGADDYVSKPFDPRELLARIKSVLRRAGQSAAEADPAKSMPSAKHLRRIGTCTLDIEGRRLYAGTGAEIALTSGEFDLLKVLVEHAGRILSRDQILDLTQNREWDPYDRSVDIRVTRLRKKLEPDPDKPRFIKTVRGVGYRFVSEGE